MTLDQLRIYVAVAEREHMTRAAEELRLTQSAVSGAIQSLETRHNISLFNRVGRRIELTPDGRFFLEQARMVLLAADAAEHSLLELRGLTRGAINLHASQTIGAYWLPERIVRFHTEHPNIEIRLSIGNTEQVAAAVSSGSAEIGFVEGTVNQPDLVAQQVGLDRLTLVADPRHPWSRLRRIKKNEITEVKWVLREKGSGTRSVFEATLARLGIPSDRLDVTLELPSNEAVRAAVEAGAGVTAISHSVVKSALRSKRLHAVLFQPLERPFVLLRHMARKQSNATKAFIAMLESLKPRYLDP